MDFFRIGVKEPNNGVPSIYPDWIVGRTKDLMVRGKGFYAVWDESKRLWSTDEYAVAHLVDEALHNFNDEKGEQYVVKSMRSFDSGSWKSFRQFVQNISDNAKQLDSKLVFANDETTRDDYASKKLPYALAEGSTSAWDELLDVLYSQEERDKIEWAIGSIVSGDSKKIQKFFVFYGPAGSGKSTIIGIIQKLFEGYTTAFDAKALGQANNQFAGEVFRTNPLVAIQHDGDLSRIEDNTMLNQIVSHEDMVINEKFKAPYMSRANAMLFMGTNQPVKITDAKSGLLRRLIDIHPTGSKVEEKRYLALMQQINFELGAIAHKCKMKYEAMGRSYYTSYRPTRMALQTDVFYNYVESHFDIFKSQEYVTLKQAYTLYKEWCEMAGITRPLPQYKFRGELENYFEEFHERVKIEGSDVRSVYKGFRKMEDPTHFEPSENTMIQMSKQDSYLDHALQGWPAQYAKADGTPDVGWDSVTTTLTDLDTKKLHYVRIPEQHIVIDFDLVDENGDKDRERNIVEASKWPATYAELSKSGSAVHLHYNYVGDVTQLSSVFDVGIEIKTLLGKSSLRRKLTECNDLEIATLNGGLPIKEKALADTEQMMTERGLRQLIERNLRKEIHPGTKSSVDFIEKILDDAFKSGMKYDVRDMKKTIMTFAMRSTNQPDAAVKAVQRMKFVSEDAREEAIEKLEEEMQAKPITFFDVEVYPNLFVICWKHEDSDKVVKMVNPTGQEVEQLMQNSRLVGFNNRRYDNHILYARYLGYDNAKLYDLSQKIINSKRSQGILFGEAYNLSYADIYDFSSKKQGLKKFEIELGIHHMELDIPWDEPVDEDKWPLVLEYCTNDVIATQAVWDDRKQDFVARRILSELSGLPVNATTQKHTARIIFGMNKEPQSEFVYTDLSEDFPGYTHEGKTSTYKGEITGEGGYVYSEPGIYQNVALLDIASMHPTSIIELNLFGDYTPNFKALMDARLAIKHGDFERARSSEILDGKLAPFLDGAEHDPGQAEALSYALKIVINIVYGLTSAKFPNEFKDNRNVDNIVAKRGALFMIDLKNALQEKGITVAHIKTDSVKIPDATPEIIQFVSEFGANYGYTFEHEATYNQLCLVNDAVYIARTNLDDGVKWTAVGAQFQHPYVFKKLFSKEELTFDDYCEPRSVSKGLMYLDFNEDPLRKVEEYVHVGRTGSFVPVLDRGANLWRINEDKKYAVTGTKGYRWIEREMAEQRLKDDNLQIDLGYFADLVEAAKEAIDYYGPFERFVA